MERTSKKYHVKGLFEEFCECGNSEFIKRFVKSIRFIKFIKFVRFIKLHLRAMDLINFMNFVFEWWLICLNNYVCSLVFQKETTEFIELLLHQFFWY